MIPVLFLLFACCQPNQLYIYIYIVNLKLEFHLLKPHKITLSARNNHWFQGFFCILQKKRLYTSQRCHVIKLSLKRKIKTKNTKSTNVKQRKIQFTRVYHPKKKINNKQTTNKCAWACVINIYLFILLYFILKITFGCLLPSVCCNFSSL